MICRLWLLTNALAVALTSAVSTGAQSPPPSAATSTTIHDAATRGDLQAVKAAIAADPAVVDAEKPPNKKTALHYAAQNGRTEVVAFLLDKGADVNRPNIAGETPLHYAAGLPDPAVVNLLLARGANPNAKTSNGGHAPVDGDGIRPTGLDAGASRQGCGRPRHAAERPDASPHGRPGRAAGVRGAPGRQGS